MIDTVPVARFEKKYHIASDGAVWNMRTQLKQKTYVNNSGYAFVALKLDGAVEQPTIHRLVALHFIPNPYPHPIVNHIDGNKLNNDVSNLEWVDESGNMQHALETGLRTGFLPLELKRAYLRRVLSGELIKYIAKESGRRQETLTKMLRTQSIKDNLFDDWQAAMKTRRKAAALRNLEIANSHTKKR